MRTVENLPLIIAILGALSVWTGSVISIVLWLTKQFKETRHYFRSAMDMRYKILDDKIDLEFGKLDSKINMNHSLLDVRVKEIELRNASQNGVR